MKYNELKEIYENNFSLSNLNTGFTEKCALISLLCYLTKELQKKKPGVTHYQVVYKFCDSLSLPQTFTEGLSIICEDFARSCKEFPTFDLKGKQVASKIKDILRTYLPF